MKHFTRLSVTALALFMLQPALSLADKDKDKMGDHSKMMMKHVDHMGDPITASILIGKNVKDKDGRDIGEVEELIVNRLGRITHVTVSFGGFMDIGDDLIPIPWPVFQLNRDLVATPEDSPLQLSVSKQRLRDAPRVNEPTHPLPKPEVLDRANTYFKDEIMARHQEWMDAYEKSGHAKSNKK